MAAKKRALGRGLDVLLGADSKLAQIDSQGSVVYKIPVTQIKPNPYQPRRSIRSESLEELTASIMEKGILQPIVVRKSGETFEIVAGERRWRAAQRARLTEVPAIERNFTDQEMLELALIENIQRENLNPVDEAHAYRRLIEEFELTQGQVAERVGKSRVAVTNTLRLLRLPDKILTWIEEDRLSAGHGRALLSLEEENLRFALSREIMNQDLSVREAERRVRNLLKSPDTNVKDQKPKIDIETADLQEKISLHLGLQVTIRPKTNTEGKIEVYYSSLDEFQRFFDHLGISLQ